MPDLFKKKPHPSLEIFVKEYWYVYRENACPVALSNTPTPEEAICFFPRNLPSAKLEQNFVKTPDTFIIRQSTTSVDMRIPNDYIMFKIIFQTGGFYKLFGVPMSLFSNGHTETVSVLGNSIKVLKEQITNALNFEDIADYADKYLINTAGSIKTYLHPIDIVTNQKNFY